MRGRGNSACEMDGGGDATVREAVMRPRGWDLADVGGEGSVSECGERKGN